MRLARGDLLPLDGKHYGTEIELGFDDGSTARIGVWIPRGRPSSAELARWGVRPDGWPDALVDDGWGGKVRIGSELPCDGHYQSEIELRIAERIVEALNMGDIAA